MIRNPFYFLISVGSLASGIGSQYGSEFGYIVFGICGLVFWWTE